jgi:N-acetylmuramate 1-kinase
MPADLRRTRMSAFLAAQGWGELEPVPLAGDASFRRYFRLRGTARRAVVMDAPPPQEDVRRYIAVAALLLELGFSAPKVFATDAANGFLLIEDFGDDTYTRLLAHGADEEALYVLAVDTLIALHQAVARRGTPDLPRYDAERLLAEAALMADWYAPAALGSPLRHSVREEYLAAWRAVLPHASMLTDTIVLRDYHIDNLMLLPDRSGVRSCGILDFQDAVCGPPTYDLVSLVRDARRDVPTALRDMMIERYLGAFPAVSRLDFRRSAAIHAAQRNCKILGIFTRLWKRDGKPAYLGHVPRIWRLLDEELGEPALAPVKRWFDRHLPQGARNTPGARHRE